ncbi:MAG TPA: hypothetical protein DDX19_22500 [Rhodopirellula baltica]|nr:hypothetical protein [Rhodopirellula baltica]
MIARSLFFNRLRKISTANPKVESGNDDFRRLSRCSVIHPVLRTETETSAPLIRVFRESW